MYVKRERRVLNSKYYHMLENLLELGIGMIGPSFDVVIGESIAKAFIKFL